MQYGAHKTQNHANAAKSFFKEYLFFHLEILIFKTQSVSIQTALLLRISLFNSLPVVLSFSFLFFLSLGKVVHLDLFA